MALTHCRAWDSARFWSAAALRRFCGGGARTSVRSKAKVLTRRATVPALALQRTHHSSRLIFPIPRLAFRQPLNGCLHPLLPCLLALGFGDPLHVFLLVAVAEFLKRLARLRVFTQYCHKIIRNH